MIETKPTSCLDIKIVKQSLTNYGNNNLVQFLIDKVGTDRATSIVSDYFIGTSDHRPGATIFWLIDTNGKVRSGKVINYGRLTGKRDRKSKATWVHRNLQLKDFILDSKILFGEHLLKKYPDKHVAVVESEKTALIASMYFPKYLWLATGGLANLTLMRCAVLAGRKVDLYPDLGANDKWKEKMDDISHICDVKIAHWLKDIATENEIREGCDIADYMLRIPIDSFGK